MSEIREGRVFESKSGKRFAVAEVSKAGLRLWSIEAGVLLDGEYSMDRLLQHIAEGNLRLTGETFDVDAAERPRIDREAAEREQRAKLAQDAAIAGERQIERMLK